LLRPTLCAASFAYLRTVRAKTGGQQQNRHWQTHKAGTVRVLSTTVLLLGSHLVGSSPAASQVLHLSPAPELWLAERNRPTSVGCSPSLQVALQFVLLPARSALYPRIARANYSSPISHSPLNGCQSRLFCLEPSSFCYFCLFGHPLTTIQRVEDRG
jgi:hypothetical protein